MKTDKYCAFFKTLGHRFIAGGDYNAKHTDWGSRLTTPKGRQLMEAIRTLQLTVTSTGEPTYWPADVKKKPDLIDFFICKGLPQSSIKCSSCFEMSSDHSPVIALVDCNTTNVTKTCKLHTKKTNWSLFRDLVEQSLDCQIPLKTDEDIIQAVEYFNMNIQEAAWAATPPQLENDKPSSSCSKYILELVNSKRKARKLWQETKYPGHKTTFNSIASKLKKALKTNTNKEMETYLRSLDATQATDYSLWKATAKLKKPIIHRSPVMKPDGTWAKSDKDKANVFAQHLSEVFTPNTDHGSSKTNLIKNELDQPHQLDKPIKKFTKQEVLTAIRKINIHKAPGYDLITAKILRELPDVGITFLTYLYNACLWKNFVPPQWKVAEIIIIPKPGKDPTDVKSYRPISLLPVPSKVMEILILKRLAPEIAANKLIPDHQFGFRQSHGTIEQVHRLVEQINYTFESKQLCSAAFLDISQAFDRVWHDGLLYKIRKGLSINFYLLIKSYLSNRHFYVKYGDVTTQLHEIRAGVPQGSVMGPMLYLIYTSDLPNRHDTITGTFADDTAVLAIDKTAAGASAKLQRNLNDISNWLKDWRIQANEAKSVQITFTLRRETCPEVELNKIKIPQADDVRYLGVYLDRRLTWKKHITTKRKALDLQLRKLYWLMRRKSQVTLENKLLLYKCILKPVWTYALQLWGTASKSNIEILQRFQSKTIRMITGAPWYITNNHLHRDLKIKMVKDEIKDSLVPYCKRILKHPNELARSLMEEQPNQTFKRLKRRAPQDLL